MGSRRGELSTLRHRADRGSQVKVYQYVRSTMEDLCVYCGGPNPDTLDRIIPKSEGGLLSWTNLAPCHKKCNQAKQSKGLLRALVEGFRSGDVQYPGEGGVEAHLPLPFGGSPVDQGDGPL